jgi:hypothetical protein
VLTNNTAITVPFLDEQSLTNARLYPGVSLPDCPRCSLLGEAVK